MRPGPVGRQAVAALPEDHPDRPKCLGHLSLALVSLFGRFGEAGILDEAVVMT